MLTTFDIHYVRYVMQVSPGGGGTGTPRPREGGDSAHGETLRLQLYHTRCGVV